MIFTTTGILLIGLSMTPAAQQAAPLVDQAPRTLMPELRPVQPTSLAGGDPLGQEMLACQTTWTARVASSASWTRMPGEPTVRVVWHD